jgi:hypothetical protein
MKLSKIFLIKIYNSKNRAALNGIFTGTQADGSKSILAVASYRDCIYEALFISGQSVNSLISSSPHSLCLLFSRGGRNYPFQAPSAAEKVRGRHKPTVRCDIVLCYDPWRTSRQEGRRLPGLKPGWLNKLTHPRMKI